MSEEQQDQLVQVETAGVTLAGNLHVPSGASGVVLFAHGSGSSRHSPRNRSVAARLQEAGLATLLLDLLTADEEAEDAATGHLRFDIGFLAERLAGATDWLAQAPSTANLAVGYFGASTGGGAALVAASRRPHQVRAVVSRGGRPDLAGPALRQVQTPTLLLVGGHDEPVIALNRKACEQLATSQKQLVIIPGASHLFAEPGTLDEVARLAANWFTRYLSLGGGGETREARMR